MVSVSGALKKGECETRDCCRPDGSRIQDFGQSQCIALELHSLAGYLAGIVFVSVTG